MSTFHVSRQGDVKPCKAQPDNCPLASLEGQAHGTREEVFEALARSQASFVSLSKASKKEESRGVAVFRDLMAARKDLLALASQRRAHGGRVEDLPEELRSAYEAARSRVRESEKLLASLPWDSEDGPGYSDRPISFVKSEWKRGRTRRGYENDLDKIGPDEHRIYEALDRASEEWLSRLSTAEVKALNTYVTDAQSYAESMAASHGAAANFTNSFKYLHSALEKAPRSEEPFVTYAGISRERVTGIREEGATGKIEMNRVQSTSMNPAMVNSFMRPSDYDGEDHTALEIRTNRVASLSLFHLREEMEVLLPPQSYDVVGVDHGVSYAYSDGYTYEPADRVYRLRPA